MTRQPAKPSTVPVNPAPAIMRAHGGHSAFSRITVLCENTATGLALLAEHGLAFWIEHQGQRILFDTGQGYVLEHNAQRLGIDLEAADAVVLSHGHFDHTGGLGTALEKIADPVVFAHPFIFAARYARVRDNAPREIGMPQLDEKAVRQQAKLVATERPTEVGPGLHVTGPIPRHTAFEDTGGPFFVDFACQEPDTFPDDQALYFETPHGTVVILGCAHAGVINTLMYVQELTAQRPIHTVIGGMHLVSASPERLEWTVGALRELGVQRLLPAHCTGFPAMARLWHEFPHQYTPCPTGTIVDFQE